MQYFRIHQVWRKLTTIIAAGALVLFATSAVANVIVIGNVNSQVKKLTQGQVKSIYLGRVHTIGKQRVRGYNQPSSSAIYTEFYKTVFNWTPRRVSSYWSSLVFGGQATQPPKVADDKAAIELTAKYSGVIAYVDSKSLAMSPLRNKIRVLYGEYHPVYNTGGYHSVSGLPPPPPVSTAPAKPAKKTTAPQNTQASSSSSDASSSFSQAPISALSTDSGATTAKQQDEESTLEDTVTPVTTHQDGSNVWQDIINHYQFSDYSNNSQVKQQEKLLLSNPKLLERMLENTTPYIGYVYQQVLKKHMPSEFALLPIIESGYDPFAYSRVGATGLWQMMPATAAGDYGLSIGWWYDQRRDILISTNAALKYLQSLHHTFGDWILAAAAYNVGQGSLEKAIHRAQKSGASINFWDLSLPKETRQYVPKLIAVAQIIKNAKHYGISLPPISDKPYFDIISLHNQMDLGEISQLSGVPVNQIRSLNPGMRRWATSPDNAYSLLLPAGSVATFQKNLRKLSGKKHVSWQYHEVHEKETLSKIAKDYRTSAALLKTVNSLKSTVLTPGQGLLVPIRLNISYQTGGVSLTSKEKGDVDSVSMDDLLSGVDTTGEDVQQQMSQLKLNQEDPSQSDDGSDNSSTEQDDSLKEMVSKIYGHEQ